MLSDALTLIRVEFGGQCTYVVVVAVYQYAWTDMYGVLKMMIIIIIIMLGFGRQDHFSLLTQNIITFIVWNIIFINVKML